MNKHYVDAQGIPHEVPAGFEHLVPEGAVEITEEEFDNIVSNLNTPTAEQVAAVISARVQMRLDDFARTREYDNMASLVSYAGDPNPQLAAEGAYGRAKRSETWVVMKQIREAVLSGQRPMPTSYEEIEPELPVLAWPEAAE